MKGRASGGDAEHRSISELCDPGLVRDRNEDATAIAEGESAGKPWAALVVCDGISSSRRADQASTIAAKTARDALVLFARSSKLAHEKPEVAMVAAIRAAQVAVCAVHNEAGDTTAPGTTIVAALISESGLTVGWMGDSRAYWVGPSGAEVLTRDHSWLSVEARGQVDDSGNFAAPLSHALTKCLGPYEAPGEACQVDPDVRVRSLSEPGHVVLCTDGLWNYFPDAAEMAGLVRAAGDGATTSEIARFLVRQALARGGADNVSVAVYAHAQR